MRYLETQSRVSHKVTILIG